MNLGESSLGRQRHGKQPLELLLSSQHKDGLSGLSFQKRIKVTHYNDRYIINNANDKYDLEAASHLNTPSPEKNDLMSTITAATTASTKTTRALDRSLPPKEIPTSQYIRHIPKQLSVNSRMRQLLIWFATKELERDGFIRKGRNRTTELVKRKLIEELRKSRSIVSWHRQMDIDSGDKQRNPQNVENEKLLIKYENDIKSIKSEIKEWKRGADKVYDHHALTVDKVAALASKGFQTQDNQTFIDDLEPDQQNFVNEFLDTEPEHRISEVVSTMDAEVNQFRLVLETANQFNIKSAKVAKRELSRLAHIINENTRLVPIDTDDNEIGLFQDSEQKRKESEHKNSENMFRLLSRK
ncbi:hypothetical protein EDC94DRAFT_623130 [Helicostylum pulchrum]|nr:hypothetical protein EDC94DRAFT_623130 [Helicostylum pulchrum]